MTKLYAIIAVMGLAVFVGGAFVYIQFFAGNTRYAGCSPTSVAGGTLGGPFELLSQTGELVTDKDVITMPTLIYFGYTYCPDVCPMDVDRNIIAIEELEKRGIIVQPVFISIDPERDTPQTLAEFTDIYHPRLLGLTGTPQQVDVASKAYKTYYQKDLSNPDDEFYLVNHSVFSYLVFPDDGVVTFFRRGISANQMADQIACYVDAHGL